MALVVQADRADSGVAADMGGAGGNIANDFHVNAGGN